MYWHKNMWTAKKKNKKQKQRRNETESVTCLLSFSLTLLLLVHLLLQTLFNRTVTKKSSFFYLAIFISIQLAEEKCWLEIHRTVKYILNGHSSFNRIESNSSLHSHSRSPSPIIIHHSTLFKFVQWTHFVCYSVEIHAINTLLIRYSE